MDIEGAVYMGATARISINVDESVKQGAQRVLNEIGMDMTTAIDSFLRTVIREERIPFILRTEQAYRDTIHKEYINTALDKSMLEANDPNIKRLSHDEVMAQLSKQREERQHV
jgi:DNA-damage-inducible protein J